MLSIKLGAEPCANLGSGKRAHSRVAMTGGLAGICRLSPHIPSLRKEAERGIQQGQAAMPTITLFSSRRGLQGLWQLLQPFAVLGRDRSCFSLFQALKAREARRS